MNEKELAFVCHLYATAVCGRRVVSRNTNGEIAIVIAVEIANRQLRAADIRIRAGSECVDGRQAQHEGDAITATATSPSGDTSEFSACVIVGGLDVIFRHGFE